MWPPSWATPKPGAWTGAGAPKLEQRLQSWSRGRRREGPKQPTGSRLARSSPILPGPVHVLVLLHALGVCSRHVDDVASGRRRERT